MNESMEKAAFMKKPLTFAKSSREYIERLWRIGIEVSKSAASIASFVSPIFNTMAKAVMQILVSSIRIHELSLTRIMFLPPFDLRSRRVTLPEEEYLPTDIGRANASFLFNVTVARKTAAKLARRIAAKTPKPALLQEPTRPPSEAELVEETVEEHLKPAKTVPHIIADLQSRFESKLAPSIKSIAAGFQEYGKKGILPTPLLGMPEPLLEIPARLEAHPSHPLVTPAEVPQDGLPERPVAVVSLAPSFPPKKAKVEPPPQFSVPAVRLRPDVASLLQYAARLPRIVLEQEIPLLKRMAAFPVVSPPRPAAPSLFERPLPAISQVPSLPHEEAKVEPPPQFLVPAVRLRPDAARSFGYAAGLPSFSLERVSRILETTAALSTASPLESSLPGIESSYRHPRPTPPAAPMRPSLVSRLLEEISPSLTSWIYGVSEVLHGTTLSLSAVPVAASTAEKVVTEALTQPVSSFEAPEILATQEPVSPVLTTSRSGTGGGRAEVKAFRLPALITSLVVALSQRYPLLLGEPTVSETYGTSLELTQVTPEETPTPSRMPEKKSFSRLPTVIALAAAESLIAHKLHHEFGGLIRQMQVARPSYGEKLGELSAFRPIRAPVLSSLKAATPATRLSPTIEPYVPAIPSAPRPLPRMGPLSPPIQNTFNITVSAESAEEDLRDLERRINKILSEQIRRYYGSPRV